MAYALETSEMSRGLDSIRDPDSPVANGQVHQMNRFNDEIQLAVASLGDHLSRIQLLVRCLAESRALEQQDIDPETELAIICWLEEADEVLGRPQRRHLERPQP